MSGPEDGHQVTGVSDAGITIDFDPRIYRLTAVKKAASKFGDRCYAHLSIQKNDWIRVTLRAKDSRMDPLAIAGEFCNEALDQELREVVAQETEPIRRLLLAQAFSATSLVDELGDDADYHADPLNIRDTTPTESTE